MRVGANVALLAAACALGAAGGTAPPTEPGDRAGHILRAAGMTGGLCVHLGCGDGALTAELSGHGRFLVHGLEPDAAAVETARQAIRSRGLYGQVWVEQWAAKRLPYAENLVNLLVADDLARTGVALDEVMRVLCPNGAAWVGGRLVRKPWPEAMDEWGHPRHGPDGNAASRDRLVGPPRRVRWVAGPMHESSNLATAGGRLFYAGLIARDAFNGLRLWERSIEPTPMRLGYPSSAMPGSVLPVAAGGHVFVVSHGQLQALDATTGEAIRAYPKAGTPRDILVDGDALVVADAASVRALDAASGRLLWAHEAAEPGDVVAGEGGVFVLEGSVRRGGKRAVVRLDRATGKPQWRQADYPWAARARRLSCGHGLLVCEVSTLNNDRPGNEVHVLAASDGKELWHRAYEPGMSHYMQARAIHTADLVWVLHKGRWEGLDPRSGERKHAWPAGTGHCYPPVATPRFLLAGEMSFTDLASGKIDSNRITKGACGRDAGFVPANGLVYCAPKHCACWPMLQGYVAMAPAAPDGAASRGTDKLHLERGPAFGKVDRSTRPSAPDEWPCYRGNCWRSSSSDTPVPATIELLWARELGGWPEGRLAQDWKENPFVRGPVTSPVVAQGLVFLARPDAHEVVALDAATGEPRWSFTANGRVDTPPTIHSGLCLFGTRSGWVYALRAKDGALAWRLRAAPSDERIVSFGQLESPWPVPGSILVVGRTAFVAAGRHPLADGGIHVFAVDLDTAQTKWATRIASLPMDRFYAGAGLEFDPFDLLVAEGKRPTAEGEADVPPGGKPHFITLSRWRMDPDTGKHDCVWQSGFGYYRTGQAGVMAPRGVWTYGPRMDYTPSGPKPGRPDYVHSSLRPLMAFRSDVLIGSSDDGRTLFRRDFTPKDAAAFNDNWFRHGDLPRGRNAKGDRNRSQRLARRARWTAALPADQQVGAVVLTRDKVFVAGTQGGLLALDLAGGKKLAERDLPAPVWDGVAAASGRLFVATRDGRVLCLGQEQE